MSKAGGSSEEIITPLLAKGLADKLYDKRKNAALEIEKCVAHGLALCMHAHLHYNFVYSKYACNITHL